MIHLHVHSDGSILDGSCGIDRLLDEVERQGEKAVAVTDHGSCIKLYEFYKKSKERNIKPILGCEFYCGEEEDKNKFHLVLLAKNNIGLKNIFNLLYKSYSNFYSKPRITYKMLEEHREGLICLSACLGGEVAKNFKSGNYEQTMNTIKYFKLLFGDDYYLEIQSNKIPFQKEYNMFIQKICENGSVKPVVTTDAHYVRKEDSESHDTMLCLKIGKKKADKERFRFLGEDFYLKTDKTLMEELYYLDHMFVDYCISNTHEIADKCNVTIEHRDLLPKMKGIDNERVELAKQCNEGFKLRKEQGAFNGMDLSVVVERIKYELNNIIDKGYAGYFLIVKDFIDFCKANDIPTGIGRGSVGGSEVAFILGISEVEPIKYNLLYERFLNPTRNSPPDIDTDICYEKRHLVIEYIKNKYGEDNVSHIIAEGKMTTKAVIRKVLSAYGYEMKAVNSMCKLVDDKCANLDEALKNEVLKASLQNKRELDDMIKLEGLISHASKHAAGVLITPEPVYNLFPVRVDKDENVAICEWHKKHIESLGAYKFDLLGLKQLTIYDKTIKQIKKNYNIDISLQDLYKIDLEDKNIYKILNGGCLNTIFQFAGDSAGAIINQMKPSCFEDIMVAESICRPGVKDAQLYLAHKKIYDEIREFPKPSYWGFVKDILEPTYGAIVYQEQTMLLFNKLGDFTLGEADSLRKVKSLEPYRERFVNGCVNKGMTLVQANELFDRFDLGYSFNKSHACAYAMNSAICCYLLAYYPKEFLASTMTLELTKSEPNIKTFINECKKFDITVLPPDINKSEDEFIAEKEGIKFPLNVVKLVGTSAYANILQNKPYKSFDDFLSKVTKKIVKKNIVINLIKSGCFDIFEPNRSKLLEKYYIIRGIKDNVFYWCSDVQIQYEIETLGYSINKHPLDGYLNKDISDFDNDTEIAIIGLLKEFRTHIDKNNKTMAFIKFENKLCEFEGVLFSYNYDKVSRFLYKGAKLGIKGKKQNNSVLINNLWEV